MTPVRKDSISQGTAISMLVVLGGVALWIASAAHNNASGDYSETFFAVALLAMIAALPLTALFAILGRGMPLKRRIIPALVCLLFVAPVIVLDPAPKMFVDNWRVERNLDEFNPIIGDLRNGTIPTGFDLDAIDIRNIKDVHPSLLHLVAARMKGGTVVAEFYVRDGTRNRAFLFDDFHTSADITSNPVLAPVLRHISGAWYEMFDQPAK